MPDRRPLRTLRIGVDFDNTIAGYDAVFLAAALHAGLLAPGFRGSKQAVRDALRLQPDGELTWQRLQGQVYGAHVASAVMLEGVDEFLRRCRSAKHEVFIVSHRRLAPARNPKKRGPLQAVPVMARAIVERLA